MARKILVTGSSGLIGSEVCTYFSQLGYAIHGVDNNQRAVFFGPQGDTRWNQKRLESSLPNYSHHEIDIHDRSVEAFALRGVEGGGGCDGAGIRALFRHADVLFARRVFDRSESFGRGVARVPQLPREVQYRGAGVQDFRLQGKTGAR